jgi:hypothetical protein
MGRLQEDREILQPLAERYAATAHLGVQQERIERYYQTNACQEVRPVVLIDEVPWGEIRDPFLVNRCTLPEHQGLEGLLRRSLYQWEHFQVDKVFSPVFQVGKHVRSTGIGLEVQDIQIKGDTGAYIASHEYIDQLATDADLARLHPPELSYDREGTERAAEVAAEVFAGQMEVEVVGQVFQYNIWDQIACYRGVDKLLLDLVERPDFMHRIARRFMEIAQATFAQCVALDLLHATPLILHCTPACARDLPAADFAGRVRPKDTWGRCSAQIFSAVSPAMHDEFDLVYNQQLFRDCGLLYYGCCEPLDTKIELLRHRFANLRKVSITPWADPARAAAGLGRDLVMAAKPNPAFVASPTFDPAPVRAEIEGILSACRRHGTACELVIKDISTIANRPENLTQWAATVAEVIDRYY